MSDRIYVLCINPFSTYSQSTEDDFQNIWAQVFQFSLNGSIINEQGWKHCGNRRHCSFWAISSFVTMLSKVFCCRGVRKRLYVGNGFNSKAMSLRMLASWICCSVMTVFLCFCQCVKKVVCLLRIFISCVCCSLTNNGLNAWQSFYINKAVCLLRIHTSLMYCSVKKYGFDKWQFLKKDFLYVCQCVNKVVCLTSRV